MPAADSPATLKEVSFDIEPGQYAAFVGPSGAGKTTVSYLVPRLHDVTAGAVLFAGDDVRELQQESLIGAIGIVGTAAVADAITPRIGDIPDLRLDTIRPCRCRQTDLKSNCSGL